MYSATLYFTDGVTQESTNYAPPSNQIQPTTEKMYSPQAKNGFYIFYGWGEKWKFYDTWKSYKIQIFSVHKWSLFLEYGHTYLSICHLQLPLC